MLAVLRSPHRGVLALLGVFLLSACGTSQSHSATTTAVAQTQSATTATTTATTSTSSTTTSASTSATATTGTPPGCQPGQLQLTAGRGVQAANQYGRRLIFTNVSSSSCTMYGYPGLQLVGTGGRAIDVPVHRGGGYALTDPGPHLITLAAGGQASFSFGGAAIEQPSGAVCPTTSAVRVIPPNDYSQLSLSVQAPACSGTGVTVTAVSAGAS